MTQTFRSSAAPAADFAAARSAMVESQLRPNKVTDQRILGIMGELPRELFVPSHLVGVAYLDDDIPLLGSRTLMQPMILARLLQAADIKPGEKLLDLAPATGYSTLVAAALTDKVFAVEPDAVLHKELEANVARYAPGRVTVRAGAPVEGFLAHAPFDVTFINGCVELVPQILFDQLAEGGRLVAVVRKYGPAHAAHTGEARLYRKTNGALDTQPLFDANIAPAPGFAAPCRFAL
ncbi:MAG: protein-L-isoaspartate O-methyltransferase [Alphaproteobacteria bacterium]|nr:protein-L-isoaspartate O-methyltransferase [Alphaproteobacteria bacterium]